MTVERGSQAGQPFTKAEIERSLADVEAEVAAFFGSLSDAELVHRVGGAWTPAEHLEHLCTAVSAVARGFAAPRWLLRLRFGRAAGPSRSYAELRDVYRGRLSGGAGATGRFVPGRDESTGPAIAERRAALLARWQRVNARLRVGAADWNERSLERLALPHPILGKLTAREMLFFTIYHNQHHIAAARSRLPRFTDERR